MWLRAVGMPRVTRGCDGAAQEPFIAVVSRELEPFFSMKVPWELLGFRVVVRERR